MLPVVTLDLILIHGIVLIQVERDDMLERKALLLVQADELLVHGSGGGPRGQSQHAFEGVCENTIRYPSCYCFACILWGLVYGQGHLFSYPQLWSHVQDYVGFLRTVHCLCVKFRGWNEKEGKQTETYSYERGRK